jgi:hypothetical protein
VLLHHFPENGVGRFCAALPINLLEGCEFRRSNKKPDTRGRTRDKASRTCANLATQVGLARCATMTIAERVRALFKDRPRPPAEIAEIVYDGKATVAQIRYVYAVLSNSSPEYWEHRERISRTRGQMASRHEASEGSR